MISSLSQERRKRKNEKLLSKENSPEGQKSTSLLMMISDATKKVGAQIEHRDKVLQEENSNKKANICSVDLSKQEDAPAPANSHTEPVDQTDTDTEVFPAMNLSEEEKVPDEDEDEN